MVRLIVIGIILLSTIFFSIDLNKFNYEKKRRHYIQFIVFILILLSGLRNVGVGSDTPQYQFIFELVKNDSWGTTFQNLFVKGAKDPFYYFFQKVFQIFTDSFQVYLLFVAIIFMSAFGNFIYRNTTKISHALLAFLLYMGNFYGFFSITGIRQTLATAFLLWSFEYIKQRRLIPFAILVVFASLFHISALVFFPLYFLAPIKKPKLIFRLSLIGIPFMLAFRYQVAAFLVTTAGAGDRFSTYLEQQDKGGSYILTALHVLLGLWALSIIDQVKRVNPKVYNMYNTFALALFLFPLQWVNPNAGRIAQYFTIIMMVWIPFLLDGASVGNPKKRQILYTITVVAFISLTLFAIGNDNYKFFWQYMDLTDRN